VCLPCWIAISSFHLSASRSPEAGNTDVAARQGRDPFVNAYQNKQPKGRDDSTPRLGAIAIFAILTPLAQGVRNPTKRARVGSIPFGYISKIDT